MDRVPHHLLSLWNPSYAADAMDAHLAVLLDRAGRWRGGAAPEQLPEEAPGELEFVPHCYGIQFTDFWFRLRDIRRLEADDTPPVIEEWKRLKNRMAPGSRRRARTPDTFGTERVEARTDRTAFRERFPHRIAHRIVREPLPSSYGEARK